MFLINAIQTLFRYLTSSPEPAKKNKIPPALRNQVWAQYHGNRETGICYACGTTIYRQCSRKDNLSNKTTQSWHCSHVQSENKGGEMTLDNLRTCCQHCNLSMGNQNLYAYIRDRNLNGPGYRNVASYFRRYPEQQHDVRTNNWNRSTKISRSTKINRSTRIIKPIITPINTTMNTSTTTSIPTSINTSTPTSTPSIFNYLLSWISK